MDRNRIQPVGGDHAIEVMAIAVEWSTPLDEAQLQALQRVYDESAELKAFLPQHAAMQALTIQGTSGFVVGEAAAQQLGAPQFVSKPGGFDARRFEPDGKPAWVMAIRPEILSCNCTVYDRWQNVKPQALKVLLPFVEAAVRLGARINAIGLQYQDAFRLLDGATPTVTGQLFRSDSALLPRHLLAQPSFWHSHQGWFSSGPGSRRVLNNVAIEIDDVQGTHFARVGDQHRVFAVSLDGSTATDISLSDIDGILHCLHDENKKVINGTLSDGALAAIGCSPGGA